MSDKIRYLKDVAIVSVSTLFTKLRGLILVALLTKSLGAEAYGLWVQIAVTLALASAVSELNLHNALIRFAAGEATVRRIAEVFWTNFILVLLLSASVVVLLNVLAQPISFFTFGVYGQETLLRLGSILVIFQSLNALTTAFFRTIHSSLWYAIYLTCSAALDIICIYLALVVPGSGILEVVTGYMLAQATILIVMLVHILRSYGFARAVWSEAKGYLMFVVPTMPALFSEWLFVSSDRFFLAHYTSLGIVAIYNVAYLLAQFVFVPVLPINKVLLPTLVKFWERRDLAQTRLFLHVTLKYYLLIAIPAVFGIIALSAPLLTLLATAEFVPIGRMIVPMVAAGVLFYGASYVLMLLFYVGRKTHYMGSLFLVSAGANVLLNFWAVPKWGALGAAATSFISYAMVFIGSLLLSRRILPVPIPYGFLGSCVILSSPILFLGFLPNLSRLSLIGIAALTACLYFLIIFKSKLLPENERRFFQSVFFKRGNTT